MLLMLAVSQACAQPVPPLNAPPVAVGGGVGSPAEPIKRIFLPPPVQWDNAMPSSRPALRQTAADFADLTGGITFACRPPR
jgi:hypothetical protein